MDDEPIRKMHTLLCSSSKREGDIVRQSQDLIEYKVLPSLIRYKLQKRKKIMMIYYFQVHFS